MTETSLYFRLPKCEDFNCREDWKVVYKLLHDYHFDSKVETPVSLDVHHDVDVIRAHFSIPKHLTVVVDKQEDQKVGFVLEETHRAVDPRLA